MLSVYLLDESSKSEKWLSVIDRFPPSGDCYTPLTSHRAFNISECDAMKRNFYFTFWQQQRVLERV